MQRVSAFRFVAFLLFFTALSSADTTETHYFAASLSPANESPPVAGVTASGEAIITLFLRRSDGGAILSGIVYFDVDYNFAAAATVTGLHIHGGGAGVNGPILIDTGITSSNTVAVQGEGNIFRAVDVSSGAALTALGGILADPSGFYVNLHTSVNTGGLMRDQLRVTEQPTPAVFVNGVVNNASFALGTNPLAPGSIAAIFGKYLNNGSTGETTRFENARLITSLGGTSVTVNGIAAPVFYSSIGQVGIQIPQELAGQTSASLQVTVGQKASVARTIAMDAAMPGLFTRNQAGTGPAAMLHDDGTTPITLANPARPGETIILFGTGLGTTDPMLPTGAASQGNRVVTAPTVTVDGVPVVVDFAGRAPDFVGLDQINVRLPANARTADDLPVEATVSGRVSNRVEAPVRPATQPNQNPVPVIASLSPSSVYVGDPAMTLTIRGSGFLPNSAVMFGGGSKAVTYVGDSELWIAVAANEIASPQVIAIRVENPGPGGGASNALNLSVTQQPPDPYDPYDDY
jgi:uncharacterized protein (TIGR03437 family)